MKHFYKIRGYVRVILFFTCITSQLHLSAQCTGGTSGGALSPAPSTSYQTMSIPSGYKYYTFVVAAATCFPTYDFSYCSADGGSATFDTQITILDNTGAAVAYDDDYCIPQSHVTWTPTAAGTYRVLLSQYNCIATSATTTLAYKYTTPPNMTYSSSTATQASTSSVAKCDVNQAILQLQVVTSGGTCPIALTQLKFSMSGTNPTADVSLIHVYYTGTSSIFAATNAFDGAGTAPASGTITVNGSQSLSLGTNYFWITYDMNTLGTTGNTVDALFPASAATAITVGGVARTLTANNPAGTRSIVVCPVSPGGVSGETIWLKANSGAPASGSVSTWTDKSTNGNNVTQATASQQPVINSTTDFNFNPSVQFDGTNDRLEHTGGIFGTSTYAAAEVYFVNYSPTPQNFNGGSYGQYVTSGGNTDRRFMAHVNFGDGTVYMGAVDDASGSDWGTYNGTLDDNIPNILTHMYNSSQNSLRLNGIPENTGVVSLSSFTGRTDYPFTVGCAPYQSGGVTFNPYQYFHKGNIAELIIYPQNMSTSRVKIESYLGVKYGITLGGNGSTTYAYMSTTGTTIWNANTGYHYDVMGIGKEVASEALDQPKSHSINSPADLVTFANSNFTTPTSLTNDGDYLLSGHQNGSLASPIVMNYVHNGPSTAFDVQLSRVWRTQKTGSPSGNVIMEFNMALVNGPTGYGTNTNADIRLLVDDDANFTNGSFGEHTYAPTAGYSATGGKIYFTVPYSDIQPGTGYYTLGSINGTVASLPIELTSFESICKDKKVVVKWSTASEINNKYFTLERSGSNNTFQFIANISGAGTSTANHNYSYTDSNPQEGTNYYRLKQTDYNGGFKYFNVIESDCILGNYEPGVNHIYPNPTNGILNLDITSDKNTVVTIELLDALGRVVFIDEKEISKGITPLHLDMEALSKGVYSLRVTLPDAGKCSVNKIVKN